MAGVTPAQTMITTSNVTDEAAAGEPSDEDAMSDDEDSAMLMLMESDVSLPRGNHFALRRLPKLYLLLLFWVNLTPFML